MPLLKVYLGDSVYVDAKYGGLELTTENGYGPSNTIFLEPEVYANLLEYVASLKGRPGSEVPNDSDKPHR